MTRWTEDLRTMGAHHFAARQNVHERSTKRSTEYGVDDWVGARRAVAKPGGDGDEDGMNVRGEAGEKINDKEWRPQNDEDGKDDEEHAHGFPFITS